MPKGFRTLLRRLPFTLTASIVCFFQTPLNALASPPALPTLLSVNPSVGKQGQSISIVLQGTNFTQGNSVVSVSGTGVTAGAVQVASDSALFATLTISATAATGDRTVTVTTPDGTSGTAVFTVTGAAVPTVTSISPPNGNIGQAVNVTLTGTNFVQNGTLITVGGGASAGIGVSQVNVSSSTSMTATLTIATGARTGAFSIGVTVGGVPSGTVFFSILGPPTLSQVPLSGPQGSTFNITLGGTNFTFGQTTAAMSGTGVTINSVTNSTSTTTRVINLTVAPNATPGSRNLTITTPGGTSGSVPFNVIVAGTYMASTIAGKSGIAEGAAATAQVLPLPRDVALDTLGNLYIASRGALKVYKRTPGGLISTFAGTGIFGEVGDSGPAAGAQMSGALSVAVDASNNVFILESNVIRKVSAADGKISVFAGRGTQGNFNLALTGFAGDGGPAASAQFNNPRGISFDAVGNLYVIDTGNYRIRKIATDGTITTVAGNGTDGYGGDGGPATSAQLALDFDTVKLAFDAGGNMYIPDSSNNRIRKVTPGGTISTIAGTGTDGFSGDGGLAVSAELNYPTAVAVDGSGNIFISDQGNNRIRKIGTDAKINTVAGDGGFLFNGDGPDATLLHLSNPAGLTADSSGNVYLVDQEANRVRMLATTGALSTVAGNAGFGGDSGPATDAQIYKPQGVSADSNGNILIADAANARIRKILASSGVISTVAGNGTFTVSGDNGPATSAGLGIPFDVAAGSGTVFYIAATNIDFGGTDSRVWKVGSDGTITTIAGGNVSGYGGDDAPAISALLNGPEGITADAAGNIYIGDTNNNRVRRINASDGKIVTVAGNGTRGYSGDNGPATSAMLAHPTKLAVDIAGNIFITDQGNGRIRKVDTNGTITTVYTATNDVQGVAAGNGYVVIATPSQVVRLFDTGGIGGIAGYPFTNSNGVSGDNGPAFVASLDVQSLTVTSSGNIIVADSNNNVLRQLTPAPANSGVLSVLGSSLYSRGGGVLSLTASLTVFPGGYFPWTATPSVTTPPGGTWLSISPGSGTGAQAITVTLDQTGLAPGTYSGSILFTSPNAVNGSFTVPVTMTIVPAVIGTNPQSLVLNAPGGFVGFNPTMIVFNGGAGGTLSVTASSSVTTPPGGSWLSVSPTSMDVGNFQNPSVLTSTINAAGLAVGTYNGTIALTAAGAANTPSNIGVTLNVTAQTNPPTLASISPANGSRGQTVIVTLSGNNFVNGGTTLNFPLGANGVTVNGGVNVISPSQAFVSLSIDPSAASGFRTITLTTSAGTTSGVTFNVLGPPTLTSVSPNTAGQDRTIVVTLAGTNFAQNATTLSVTGTGVTLVSFPASTSPTSRTATLKIDSNAPLGNRSLTVSTPAGTTSPVSFSITGPEGYLISGAAGRSVIVEGGTATLQPLPPTTDVAFDSLGNLYVAVSNGNKVLKVTPGGALSTFAGTGTQGAAGDGGPATSAQLNGPRSVIVDSQDNVLIADSSNHRIRKVAPNGTITTFAGTGLAAFTGDGGPALFANLNFPAGLGIDSSGNVYIADINNRRVRKVDTSGNITTVAGNGTQGFFGDGLAATVAQLNMDTGTQKLAIDSAGNLFIPDTGNQRIRKVATDGTISTIAGTGVAGYNGDGIFAIGASVSFPRATLVDSNGALLISDNGNHRIRKIAGGMITTIAGNGVAGFNGDGPTATTQQLTNPLGLARDSLGNLLIADQGSNRVRRVTTAGAIATVAGSGGVFTGDGVPATTTEFYNPNGVAFDLGGNLLIADSRNFRIRKVDSGGTVTTIAGTGVSGISPDGTVATSALINFINDIAVDTAGNLYMIGGSRVRKVNASDGKINTVAGTGAAGYGGDNGPATSALLNNSVGIAVDASGNIYIADTNNNRVRKVNASDNSIITIAGTGTAGPGGDNGPATSAQLNAPRKVAVDGAGNVYIADSGNTRIRRIAPDQTITTFSTFGGTAVAVSGGSVFVGSGSQVQQVFSDGTFMNVSGLGPGISGDNGPALMASISNSAISVSPSGTLHIADAADNVVRKLTSVAPGSAVLSVTPSGINSRLSNLTSATVTETLVLYGTGVFTWTAATSVVSPAGSQWLSISPDSGTGGTPILVTVNAAGLPPGFYNGSVTFTSPQAVNGSVVVPVTLTVLPSTLSPTIVSVSVSSTVNGSNPGSQIFSVNNGGSGPAFGFSVAPSVTTPPGGSWLSVTPGSGTTGSNSLTASFNIAGLGSGIYTGNIAVTSAQAANSPLLIPVALTINPTVAPTLTSITPSTGSPGQAVTVTLTGANFSPLGNILDPMADISTSPVVLLDGTTLMTTFTIGSNATLGDRTVRVTSNGLLSGTVTFSIVQSKKRRGQLTTVP